MIIIHSGYYGDNEIEYNAIQLYYSGDIMVLM